MPVQTCKFEPTKIDQCGTNLGLAERWFGLTEADLEARCGRFARGKSKGLVRGWIVFRKVSVGGWSYPLQTVLRPGMVFAHFCTTYDDAGRVATLPTDRFFPCAKRVDTQYGYDWRAAAKKATEQATQAAQAAQAEATRKAEEQGEWRDAVVKAIAGMTVADLKKGLEWATGTLSNVTPEVGAYARIMADEYRKALADRDQYQA